MDKYNTVIIGGGAAGICAAISAARSGETVVI
ncbi:MAG TPA: FAD-dependent oxidoreductase, partial [Dehalococcoidales bacterium]|nr:FAD-dependent oxidoreductase [Dehalococcoidales bacterium]